MTTDKKDRKTHKTRKPLKPKQVLNKIAEAEATQQEKDVMYKYGVGDEELDGSERR
jgi:hypothetical protein